MNVLSLDIWHGWALSRKRAGIVAAALAERRPKSVLECGSGSSTLLFAEYARQTGASVLSLDHDRKYARQTVDLLVRNGFLMTSINPPYHYGGDVDLHVVPLSGRPQWYLADELLLKRRLDGKPFDFVLIDGPPGSISNGRRRSLPSIWPYLTDDFEVWLDDSNRRAETRAIDSWIEQLEVEAETFCATGENKRVCLDRIHRGEQ